MSESRVYLIRCQLTGYVKIGTTNDVPGRLAMMQTGSPGVLQLVVAIDGDARVERALHQRFHAKKYRGEWFALTDADIALVPTLKERDLRPLPSALSDRVYAKRTRTREHTPLETLDEQHVANLARATTGPMTGAAELAAELHARNERRR